MSPASDPSIRRGTLVPDSPGLSICILVLEHAALALDCLDALRRPGGCPPGTEVVVVANGTPPEQLDSLAGHDEVVLVVNEVNLGFGAGCNQAASVARAPLLVFLNDDSTVEEGCIDALVRTASSDPEIGAVGSRILAVDGTLQEAGSVLWRDGSAAHVGEGLPPGPMPISSPGTWTTPPPMACWSPAGPGTPWAGSTSGSLPPTSRMSTCAWLWPLMASGPATSPGPGSSTGEARARRVSIEDFS